MREPAFWWEEDGRSRRAAPLTRALLEPLAALYAFAGARRLRSASPWRSGVPVLCIGNLTLGGAGKTPVTAALRAHMLRLGLGAATLSRGYRGKEPGPLRVVPGQHDFRSVGDEPLLLARGGPAYIARDRPAGARAIEAAGHAAILLDDGHQNPSLHKDISFVVIDTARAFGNRRVFPAGPLREPIAAGLARTDAIVLMGPQEEAAAFAQNLDFGGLVFSAELAPLDTPPAEQLVAFAGIGRPAKMFDSLRAAGARLADCVSFPDHHPYSASDLADLHRLAAQHDARLITTEKDVVRLPQAVAANVLVWRVAARFHQPDRLEAFLSERLAQWTPAVQSRAP